MSIARLIAATCDREAALAQAIRPGKGEGAMRSEDVTYHDVYGLDILAAARMGGYLVWRARDLAWGDDELVWRAGTPARDASGVWQLATNDGVYDIVVAGVSLAQALLGEAPDMWDAMAVAIGRRIIAVAHSEAGLNYVWPDSYVGAVIYPAAKTVYGPYRRQCRQGWHTISADV